MVKLVVALVLGIIVFVINYGKDDRTSRILWNLGLDIVFVSLVLMHFIDSSNIG